MKVPTFQKIVKYWEIDRITKFYSTLEQFKEISTSEDYLTWLGVFY